MAAALRTLDVNLTQVLIDFFEDEDGLESAYDSFLDQFETSDGGSVKIGHEADAEAMEDDELGQEQIVKQKRG